MSNAKIRKHHMPITIQQDISRLHVSVDHLLAVCMIQRRTNLFQQASDLIQRRQRIERSQVVDDSKVFIEVGEQQNGKVESRLIFCQFSLAQIFLLLMRLQLRLDDVGVCHLAALLELLADPEKSLCLFIRSLHRFVFVLGGEKSVEGLGHRNSESPQSNFRFRSRYCLGGRGAAVIRKILQRQALMDIPLCEIFVNPVIGNENLRRDIWIVGVCRLGVYGRHVVGDIRQHRRPALHQIFVRQTKRGNRSLQLRIIGSGSLQRVGKSDSLGRDGCTIRLRILRRGG